MSVIMIFCTVMITGLGCGLGCGSLSTPMLIGRMIGEARTTKECIIATGIFSLGKILMYMILGFFSALFGNMILENVQKVYPSITQNVFRLMSIVFGTLILINTLKKKKCSSCRTYKTNNLLLSRFKDSSYLMIGLIYAVIPCSPLFIALTYATGLDPVIAVLLMLCFGIVNSIFSVAIYAPIVGTIIGKMKVEIPQYFKYIQVFSAIILIGMAILIEFN